MKCWQGNLNFMLSDHKKASIWPIVPVRDSGGQDEHRQDEHVGSPVGKGRHLLPPGRGQWPSAQLHERIGRGGEEWNNGPSHEEHTCAPLWKEQGPCPPPLSRPFCCRLRGCWTGIDQIPFSSQYFRVFEIDLNFLQACTEFFSENNIEYSRSPIEGVDGTLFTVSELIHILFGSLIYLLKLPLLVQWWADTSIPVRLSCPHFRHCCHQVRGSLGCSGFCCPFSLSVILYLDCQALVSINPRDRKQYVRTVRSLLADEFRLLLRSHVMLWSHADL